VSWSRIRGHEHWVQAFADVVDRGRLAHAYLFAGPQGVGKKMFAEELTKTLLCEKPASKFAACDQCHSCVQVEAGTHPDVIRAARPEDRVEFPIAVMRTVLEQMALKPARGSHKIAIIDDADDLNEESANAFLKTLEEPPPNALLILIATDPEGQLPTIVSRCQVIRFQPLPVANVVEILRQQGVEQAKSEQLARLSGGSPGLALGLADSALWEFRQKMVEQLASARPNMVRLSKEWEAFVQEAGKDGGSQRRRSALCIDLLIDVLDNAVQYSVGVEPLALPPQEKAAVRTIAERYGQQRLLELVERCLEAKRHIDRMVQLVLADEALLDAFA